MYYKSKISFVYESSYIETWASSLYCTISEIVLNKGFVTEYSVTLRK